MMNLKISTPVLFFCLGFFVQAQAAGIYDVRNHQEITRFELLIALDSVDQIILGEKHFDKFIVNEASSLMRDWQERKQQPLTFAWEFLDASDQVRVSDAYSRVQTGEITSFEMMRIIFGDQASEVAYAPMISAAADTNAELLAVNLSRSEKAPVVQNGISALDPALLPPGFEVGSATYFDRFVEAMGGHGDPSKVQNYYEAQCLVDDVIAFHLTTRVSTPLSFLLIGDFHTSYREGTYSRLEIRDPLKARSLIQFVENKSEAEDAKYGEIADFVFFQSN